MTISPALLIAALCALPLPGAAQSADRFDLFTAAAEHVRAFAPVGARIYIHPSDSTNPDELRKMSAATAIPIGARTDVLVCPRGCYAPEGTTIVLVRILAIEPSHGDAATVELELYLYEPDRRSYAQRDRIHLVRSGDSWRIHRVERVWET